MRERILRRYRGNERRSAGQQRHRCLGDRPSNRRAVVRRSLPDKPHWLREARKGRRVAGVRPAFTHHVCTAQHSIFGDQIAMLDREDVGRDQPIGERQPAVRVSPRVIVNDKVKVEHPPVQLCLAQARAVEQNAERTVMPPRDRLRQRADAVVDGPLKLVRDEPLKRSHAARRRKGIGAVERNVMGRPGPA